MQEFANTVKDLKSEDVETAATAGKIMSEMASTLPNSGGVVSWFTGNNDMDKFGEQLIPFGEAMQEFANTVKDLKSEDIEAAATAGKMMAEMASTLPNTGGVVSWFTGNNDMDKFGKQLIPFGEAIKHLAILLLTLKVKT